jgi:hypothetical protein
MAVLTYVDFDLLIERSGERYKARVLSSPGGSASRSFELPFSREQLQIFVLKAISLGARRRVRRIESPELAEIKEFGGQLFEAVFDGEVHDCLRTSLHDVERDRTGLRIRLRLDDTVDAEQTQSESIVALSDVPWEFMFDSDGPGFLCLSSGSPVVRYQDLRKPVERIVVESPLRLLVMICAPTNAPELEVEHERAKVEEALGDLVQDGLVEIDWLEHGTLKQLQRRLRSDYHAFHFIGHGGFDERAKTGALLFENASGFKDPVSAEFLRTLFQDRRTLQLAVLNACEGSRTDPTDPFAGVAQSLVRGGVAAVIAMQFEISDDAAIILSSEFYSALADGYPVDAALSEARTAVYTRASAVEWAIPVLYLRSPDAAIFDVTAPPPIPSPPGDKKDERKKQPPGGLPRGGKPDGRKRGDGKKKREERKSFFERLSRRTKLIAAAVLVVVIVLVLVGVALIDGDEPVGSLDGDLLFVQEGDIIAVDPATQAETLLVEGDSNDFAPSLSRDQTEVVFGAGPDGADDIFIAGTDNSDPRNLTESPENEQAADWSPDGSRIAFDRAANGNFDIYAISPSGSDLERLTRFDENEKLPKWSPDGSQIVFESDRFGQSDVFVMDADGSDVRRLTDSSSNDGAPVWSQDGRMIAFRSNRSGKFEVWVMSADGEDEHQVTQDDGDVRAPAWSPNNREIVYASDSQGTYDLYVVDVASGESTLTYESPKSDRGTTWCCF